MKSVALLSWLSLAVLVAADPANTAQINEQSAFTFYQSFKRLTNKPHHVAPLTAILCRFPSPELIEREKAQTGPHYQARVHIYANPLAAEAVVRKLDAFPVGAVIVKEKLAEDDSPTAVGGMIKRAAGFDPKGGDWEYFYAAKGGGFSIGRLKNCADCHAGAKATDYVYSVWKPFGEAASEMGGDFCGTE